MLSNVVQSQIDIHAHFGGVVPEIAARSHIEAIGPVVDEALAQANCTWDDIDAIAVTYAPGLIGSLLVGSLAARTLAILHSKPLYPVHHVEGHVYANFITEQAPGPVQLALPKSQPRFPLLALIVSGDTRSWCSFATTVIINCWGKPKTTLSAKLLTRWPKFSACPTLAARRLRARPSRVILINTIYPKLSSIIRTIFRSQASRQPF